MMKFALIYNIVSPTLHSMTYNISVVETRDSVETKRAGFNSVRCVMCKNKGNQEVEHIHNK